MSRINISLRTGLCAALCLALGLGMAVAAPAFGQSGQNKTEHIAKAGAGAVGGLFGAAGAMTTTPPDPGEICRLAIRAAERARRIPLYLLEAIALGESGRAGLDGAALSRPWPWTVTSGGKGQHFPTRTAAIDAVRDLQNQGIRNIDVGCMQINLRYHPHAFNTLEQAFDPIQNVAYGATFLLDLRARERSWTRAVKYYHSRTGAKNRPYHRKISKLWRRLRHHYRNRAARG